MFKVNSDGSIELTRGDNAAIEIVLTDMDGNPYEYLDGDQIYLRIKKQVKDSVPVLIEKVGDITTSTFELVESDTKNLDFGDYRYEVELVTADKEHYTVITDTKFTIGKEIEVHG